MPAPAAKVGRSRQIWTSAVILTRQVGVHTDYMPGGVVKFRTQLNEPLDSNEIALHANQPDRPMPFHMTVGLFVLDHEKYAQYRAEIAPLLAAAGARFRYDFEVARTLKSEGGHDINRLFVIQFPDRVSKERFFTNPQYIEIRTRLFEKAVERTLILTEHDG